MAGASWPVLHGRCFMAGASWPVLHGRYFPSGGPVPGRPAVIVLLF
jgi:hypothetical protein